MGGDLQKSYLKTKNIFTTGVLPADFEHFEMQVLPVKSYFVIVCRREFGKRCNGPSNLVLLLTYRLPANAQLSMITGQLNKV